MTPKQKAIDLWTSYRGYLSLTGAPLGGMKDMIAKQCALHTVSEIQEALDRNEDNIQNLDRKHVWWNRVETEVKNL